MQAKAPVSKEIGTPKLKLLGNNGNPEIDENPDFQRNDENMRNLVFPYSGGCHT